MSHSVRRVLVNFYIRSRALLEIPGPGGSTYDGVLPMLYEIGNQPSVGERLRLRVDPKNRQRFALDPSHVHDVD